MRNKILIIGGIAFLAYILGSRALRMHRGKSESGGRGVARPWTEPQAKKMRANEKARAKRAKARAKDAKKLVGMSRNNTKHALKTIHA